MALDFYFRLFFYWRDLLDETGTLQGLVGTVFREGLESPRGRLDGDKLFQFGHPDALGFQIRLKETRGDGRDVHADAALLFSQATAVDC